MTNSNTFVYAPIKELMLEEVWYIINAVACPGGLIILFCFKYMLMLVQMTMSAQLWLPIKSTLVVGKVVLDVGPVLWLSRINL